MCERLIQCAGFDAHQAIADDELAGHEVAPVLAAAAKALPGLLAQGIGPVGDGFVAAHAAQDRARGDAQHDGQAMAAALGATRVGDVREAQGQ